MISEGVDIKRLRVLVYLPNALTELAFRQAIGRVVRTNGNQDFSRAYVVLPALELFDRYAKRIEDEMPKSQHLFKPMVPAHKKCPECGGKNDITALKCDCGYIFPPRAKKTLPCSACGHENNIGAEFCDYCGESLIQEFSLSLEEALRDGVITRGIVIEEEELTACEPALRVVREMILKSGDAHLVELMRIIPTESIARLKTYFDR